MLLSPPTEPLKDTTSFSESISSSRHQDKEAKRVNPFRIEDFPALHLAAAQGDFNTLKQLIKDDNHRKLRGGDGSTALHHASARGHLQCASALIKYGVSVNAVDNWGYSALHWAAHLGHLPIVRALLEAEAKPNLKDHAERATPLHFAAFAGHTDIVEALVAAGCSASSTDRWRQTPLHKAAFNDHLTTVYYLIKHANARVDARDASDMTALHYASARGNLSVLRLLISKSSSMNLVTREGNTPLHLAAAVGQYSCVLSLVSDSAIVDILNNKGLTPLELARMFGHDAVARLLVDEGAEICMRYRTGKFSPSEQQTETPFMEKMMEDSRIDRYGFIKKNQSQNQVLSRKVLKRDELRTEKWLEMFQERNWPPTRPSAVRKLRQRIRKGIPNKVRGLAWRLITRADSRKYQYPEGYYLRLLHSGSPHIKQIDLDIARTFREHSFFVERYGRGERSLFNVLKAYSVHNPQLGYTQGMNSIVAVLLMYMHEEDVFWTLDTLMTNQTLYGMNDLFVPGFPKLFLYFQVLEQLVKNHLPRLHRYFAANDMVPSTYCTRWFLMLFIGQVPFYAVLRIWDIFLAEGNYILFCVALALLKMHQSELLRRSFDKMMELFYTFPETPLDDDRLIKLAMKFARRGVDPEYIEFLLRQLSSHTHTPRHEN